MKKIISTTNAPAPIGAYSQAIESQGTMLFLSGQIPLDAEGNLVIGGIEVQTKQVLHNIEAVLNEADYTVANIVKTTVFLKDMNYFPKMNTVYGDFFGESMPARSAVEVSRLPKDVMVEIEVIAMK